jgi:hypothetical protein
LSIADDVGKKMGEQGPRLFDVEKAYVEKRVVETVCAGCRRVRAVIPASAGNGGEARVQAKRKAANACCCSNQFQVRATSAGSWRHAYSTRSLVLEKHCRDGTGGGIA